MCPSNITLPPHPPLLCPYFSISLHICLILWRCHTFMYGPSKTLCLHSVTLGDTAYCYSGRRDIPLPTVTRRIILLQAGAQQWGDTGRPGVIFLCVIMHGQHDSQWTDGSVWEKAWWVALGNNKLKGSEGWRRMHFTVESISAWRCTRSKSQTSSLIYSLKQLFLSWDQNMSTW